MTDVPHSHIEETRGFAEQLRIAIGVGLIQSGYIDQDEDGTVDVLQWHPCPECPHKTGLCACSGVPYLSDEVWTAADRFGDLTKVLAEFDRLCAERDRALEVINRVQTELKTLRKALLMRRDAIDNNSTLRNEGRRAGLDQAANMVRIAASRLQSAVSVYGGSRD